MEEDNKKEEFENLYEVVKTVRFGLTTNATKTQTTHLRFNDLTNFSIKKLENEAEISTSEVEIVIEKEAVLLISNCLPELIKYVLNWQSLADRVDVIKVSEDYYRFVARKARFNSFQTDNSVNKYPRRIEKKVTPKVSSGYINLNQKTKYLGKLRSEYISLYWLNLAGRISIVNGQINPHLKKYVKALKESSKANEKPNLIQFKKLFLSLSKVLIEYLEPLTNSSILIDKVDKLNESTQNTNLKDFFVNDSIITLRKQLSDLKKVIDYFSLNGALIPFDGKASLNYFTALQKPNLVKDEIEELIKDLELQKFIEKYLNSNFNEAFKFDIHNKHEEFLKNPHALTKLELAQIFKPKPIPVILIPEIASYFGKKLNKDYQDVEDILLAVGESLSISNDWKNLSDEDRMIFSLNKYPIKTSFDYAWENLARYRVGLISHLAFAKDQSEKFLQEFDININDSSFVFYSDLLFISDKFAILEHSFEEIKDNYEKNNIIFTLGNKLKDLQNPYKENTTELKNFKISVKTLQESLKEVENLKTNIEFQEAKQKIGLIRGGLKNKVEKYSILTEKFGGLKNFKNKGISSYLGKKFAGLRDKIREKDEINKIGYYSIIIQDNNDNYLLLNKLNYQDSRDTIENLLKNDSSKNALQVKKVVSLTSKTLKKLWANKGSYLSFHLNKLDEELTNDDDTDEVKKTKKTDYLKLCLINSEMAVEQSWQESFGWKDAIINCKTYEDLEKVLDSRGYKTEEKWILEDDLKLLVKHKDCLLLPIVNQDIIAKGKARKDSLQPNQNQFTYDFSKSLKNKNGYRLHPEISLFYQLPSIKPDQTKNETWETIIENHHAKILNRNSRFQIIGNFGVEIKPENSFKYISKKEQIKIWQNQSSFTAEINKFNEKIKETIKTKNDYYIFGIDRGIKQLATLCITNKNGEIQENNIYIREFDHIKKIWIHKFLEKRFCLDLSNLRVETTFDGKKVLVDLAEIKVKDNTGTLIKDNIQKIKLKQAAYIRKLQYLMSSERQNLLNYINDNKNLDNLEEHIQNKQLFSPFKEGANYDDLQIEKLKDLLIKFYRLHNEEQTLTAFEKQDLKQETEELDPTNDLKRGVVGNMVGVISYLIEKYDYNVLIALENLNRSFYSQKDGLTDELLDKNMSYKDMENRILCGLGTYQFFETQLLRKLSRIQQEKSILSLVPSFRSRENYESITKYKKPLVYNNFGVIYFVDPRYTSKKCPVCGEISKINRNNNNITTCNNCGFITGNDNIEILKKYNKSLSLNNIKNADENGAYNIAMKLNKIMGSK